MALRTCNDCGKEFSNSAQKCPYCGAQNLIKKIGQIIGLIVFCIFCLFCYFTLNEMFSKSSGKSSSKSQQAACVLDIRPASQKNFEDICVKYAMEYNSKYLTY